MATEFDKIKDLAGWQDKLKELLAAAEKASAKNDADARLAVASRLNQFVLGPRPTRMRSSPSISWPPPRRAS